ncbi:hypothetical protein BHM03_00039971 [Ensete ventricosum]|uniref:Uncharacterized protein n=1 Tax=Ensete ventricosum TaxID=4639 RepID=A0A445MK48_ENSVE|nr:hypothetical protein BHM03_00039971 [Ensete ventricosum]
MTQHPPKNMRSPKRSASPGASESCSSITGVSDGASFGLPRNKRRSESGVTWYTLWVVVVYDAGSNTVKWGWMYLDLFGLVEWDIILPCHGDSSHELQWKTTEVFVIHAKHREMPKDLLSSSASPAAGSHPYYKKGAVKSASLTLCSHPSSDGCDRMNQMLTSRILQPHWSPCGQNAEPGDKVW